LSETENYFPDEESKTTDWMRYTFDDTVIIVTHIILGVDFIEDCARFQASVSKYLRTALFWVIMQRVVVLEPGSPVINYHYKSA